MEGTTSTCSVSCQQALVGLISTAEGERLMDCTCQDPDCSLEKKRVEPCREEVIRLWTHTNQFQSMLNICHFRLHGTQHLTPWCPAPQLLSSARQTRNATSPSSTSTPTAESSLAGVAVQTHAGTLLRSWRGKRLLQSWPPALVTSQVFWTVP